jgi:hydroxyacylglutathione hydrolase
LKIIDDVYVVGGGIYGIGLSEELDCNVYLIDCGDEAVLIDCGIGVHEEVIAENINKECDIKKLKKLFITHAHLDHSGGAYYFKQNFKVDIFVSEKEGVFLENGDEEAIGLIKAKESGIYPETNRLKAVNIDCRIKGWEEFRAGKYTIQAIPTPGHSRGSVCYLLKDHKKRILFTGDTVFLGGYISLQNLPDSSLAEYAEGIKNLEGLNIDTLLPSHNGFIVNGGQHHIDIAIKALSGLTGFRKIIAR